MTRKAATPASTTRIRIPVPVAVPEKSRSPTRRTGRWAGACGVVVTPAPRDRDGGRNRVGPPDAGRPVARGVEDAPGHGSAAPADHAHEIASTAFWLC